MLPNSNMVVTDRRELTRSGDGDGTDEVRGDSAPSIDSPLPRRSEARLEVGICSNPAGEVVASALLGHFSPRRKGDKFTGGTWSQLKGTQRTHMNFQAQKESTN
jgi:hypothetical protein